MSARWRRAIFSNPIRMSGARTHGVSGRLPHRALRRCATTGAGRRRVSRMRSAGRTRFQLTPDSVRGRDDEERCTAGRCRCRCSAGVCRRRRSAALRGMGKMLQTCDEKNVEKFAKSLRKSYLCNELKDRTLN